MTPGDYKELAAHILFELRNPRPQPSTPCPGTGSELPVDPIEKIACHAAHRMWGLICEQAEATLPEDTEVEHSSDEELQRYNEEEERAWFDRTSFLPFSQATLRWPVEEFLRTRA